MFDPSTDDRGESHTVPLSDLDAPRASVPPSAASAAVWVVGLGAGQVASLRGAFGEGRGPWRAAVQAVEARRLHAVLLQRGVRPSLIISGLPDATRAAQRRCPEVPVVELLPAEAPEVEWRAARERGARIAYPANGSPIELVRQAWALIDGGPDAPAEPASGPGPRGGRPRARDGSPSPREDAPHRAQGAHPPAAGSSFPRAPSGSGPPAAPSLRPPGEHSALSSAPTPPISGPRPVVSRRTEQGFPAPAPPPPQEAEGSGQLTLLRTSSSKGLGLRDLRLCVVGADRSRGEIFVEAVRRQGVRAVFIELDAAGPAALAPAAHLDPHAVVVDLESLDQEPVRLVRFLRRHPRFRWASLFPLSFRDFWPELGGHGRSSAASPDPAPRNLPAGNLLGAFGPVLQAEAATLAQLDRRGGGTVDLPIPPLGIPRLVRLVARSGQRVRMTLLTSEVVAALELRGGWMVRASWRQEDPVPLRLEGPLALASWIAVLRGSVRVGPAREAGTSPSVPVEAALDEAAAFLLDQGDEQPPARVEAPDSVVAALPKGDVPERPEGDGSRSRSDVTTAPRAEASDAPPGAGGPDDEVGSAAPATGEERRVAVGDAPRRPRVDPDALGRFSPAPERNLDWELDRWSSAPPPSPPAPSPPPEGGHLDDLFDDGGAHAVPRPPPVPREAVGYGGLASPPPPVHASYRPPSSPRPPPTFRASSSGPPAPKIVRPNWEDAKDAQALTMRLKTLVNELSPAGWAAGLAAALVLLWMFLVSLGLLVLLARGDGGAAPNPGTAPNAPPMAPVGPVEGAARTPLGAADAPRPAEPQRPVPTGAEPAPAGTSPPAVSEAPDGTGTVDPASESTPSRDSLAPDPSGADAEGSAAPSTDAPPEARAAAAPSPAEDGDGAAQEDGAEEPAWEQLVPPGPARSASRRMIRNAAALTEQGRRDRAIRTLEKALSVWPTDPYVAAELSRSLLEANRAAEALAAAAVAIRHRPRRGDYRLLRGDCLAALGDWNGAALAWRKALRFDGRLASEVANRRANLPNQR